MRCSLLSAICHLQSEKILPVGLLIVNEDTLLWLGCLSIVSEFAIDDNPQRAGTIIHYPKTFIEAGGKLCVKSSRY